MAAAVSMASQVPSMPVTSVVDFVQPVDACGVRTQKLLHVAPVKSAVEALKTPISAGYPSNVQSPLTSTLSSLKRDDSSIKTPVTPPSAYLDFLRNLSPGLASPHSTVSGTQSPFAGKSTSPACYSRLSSPKRVRTSQSPPANRRPKSYSVTSVTALHMGTIVEKTQRPSNGGLDKVAGDAPYATWGCRHSAPTSAPEEKVVHASRSEPPRRPSLVIPPSPSFQPTSAVTASQTSAKTNTPSSAARSPSGNLTPVTIRHVITRTVTYARPPGSSVKINPSQVDLVGEAPKGKRRKIE